MKKTELSLPTGSQYIPLESYFKWHCAQIAPFTIKQTPYCDCETAPIQLGALGQIKGQSNDTRRHYQEISEFTANGLHTF